MTPSRLKLNVKTFIPPGDSVVAVYPQHLFRIDQIITHALPGVDLLLGGTRHACDGSKLRVRRDLTGITLSLGGFFAFHAHNHGDATCYFELTLEGLTIDCPVETYDGHSVVGLFSQVAEDPELNPSPETQPS